MEKVINDLMDQNELLLQTLFEVQQSAKNRSMQMYSLLKQTANITCDVGLALSSYELEMKKFSQQNIPLYIEDCVDCVEHIKTHVEYLEHKNNILQRENESFFQNIQYQNAELMQYKAMVYCLISGQKETRINNHLPQRYLAIMEANFYFFLYYNLILI